MGKQLVSFDIRVPATSANLGAGFDCLAVAFNLWNQAHVEIGGKGFHVHISGEGEGILPEDADNLIIKSFQHTLKTLKVTPPAGVVFHCENHIPLGSGLGSSATAVLIGVIAATVLKPECENKDTWLQISAELEGHADNVAAAIYGGLVAVRKVDGRYKTQLIDIEPDTAVVILPDIDLPTHTTRQALPKNIPLADAVFNISRIPAILEGMRMGDVELLREGLEDRIHQPYRLPLIPGSFEAVQAANQSGAAGALSGAGPSVIAFMPDNEETTTQAMSHCFEEKNMPFRVFHLEMINRGAQITRS